MSCRASEVWIVRFGWLTHNFVNRRFVRCETVHVVTEIVDECTWDALRLRHQGENGTVDY